MITAVVADALLNPATGETARDAVVLIEDGKVTKSGKRDGTPIPRDAKRIDASGLTLLPGLIDCHVHLTSLGEGLDFARELTTPPTLELMRAVLAARKTLDAGFTSVRDAAGTPAGVKMAIERGFFPGPRMFVTITALSQTGGHTDSHFLCGVDLDIPLPDRPHGVVDGAENMRLRVRQVLRAGADWIKLCTSGGVLSPGDSPHHAMLNLDEIRAAVDEAAAQGRQVMAHAQANVGIKNALKAGVATIEHGIWLDGDAIEMMLDGHNGLIPTLVAPRWVIRHAEAGKMPAYAIGKAKEVIEDHKASIKMAIESGVKIAFGTDMGVGPHGLNGEEFLLMRELGMEPIDCIRAATTVAAETIGMKGVGSLDAGSWGDVIGVPGDPVANLELLSRPENVQLVVKGGDVVKTRTQSTANSLG
ncbi:MAG TPA: amidohydrolase family protein [Candidatus Dormibacteraeota bacterium]|nr:amidohydrolase family protein [Candidatus Dormibacteraeota bacterium]